jgi:hypothetical protein
MDPENQEENKVFLEIYVTEMMRKTTQDMEEENFVGLMKK